MSASIAGKVIFPLLPQIGPIPYSVPRMQEKHPQWAWQWSAFHDDNRWLFTQWIAPNTLEDFRGKDVLDCGCGGGQHLSFVAPYARRVVGVDLNAAEVARKNTEQFPNVDVREGDLAHVNLGEQFDVVYSIGVLHHTDDPDRSFANIARQCKVGGRVIVWVYSKEGNFLNHAILEPIKRLCIHAMPRPVVWFLGRVLTALLYVPIYTIYLVPLRLLPYYEYFGNWRRLSFERNFLNVFDKLNAPQTIFITKEQITRRFAPDLFTDVHISPYAGVSWRGSGTKR